MFEELMSIPAIWASMNSWFTPPVLFVILNAMIGTIFVTSRLPTSKQQTKDDPQQQQTQLHRSPSMLQRLKSINLYHYTHRSQEPTTAIATDTSATDTAADAGFIPTPQSDTHQQEEQTHEEEEEEEEAAQEGEKSLDEVYSQLQEDRHVSRSVSDTKPSSGEVPVKLARKMKKSASAKSSFAHFEEEDIEARRPATVRERKAKVTEEEGDDKEVDAKADDFIYKFKQQLKLQKLDSIIRDKEVLTRGSGK